jgi:uncharacterized protein (DUF58 family)
VNAIVGWALAVAGTAMAYVSYGWPGVALAVTVVVFWLLLQFSRALRVLRVAGQAPVGRVDSAVMLHAKLRQGMRLMEIIVLTRSLGRKVGDDPETYLWKDASDAAVRVELRNGRCTGWRLERPDGAPEADGAAQGAAMPPKEQAPDRAHARGASRNNGD